MYLSYICTNMIISSITSLLGKYVIASHVAFLLRNIDTIFEKLIRFVCKNMLKVLIYSSLKPSRRNTDLLVRGI